MNEVAKSVIERDSFLRLPAELQLLYFRLVLNADNYGTLNNPKAVMRAYNLERLGALEWLEKEGLIAIRDGYVVIVGWCEEVDYGE